VTLEVRVRQRQNYLVHDFHEPDHLSLHIETLFARRLGAPLEKMTPGCLRFNKTGQSANDH
jgi:hypothetical protein